LEFDNKHENLQITLEKSLEIMQQCILQNNQINQELIERSARRNMHFDEITTYLNQPASTPTPDQTQEFHQCYQVNQLDKPQESTQYFNSNLELVPSSFHLNQIKEFE